jgi:hypothetical protein
MRSSPPADVITDLDGLEKVRELGSSRFGTVRLLRRTNSDGTFELFAAKFYNVGDSREALDGFEARMKQLLELSHPHVTDCWSDSSHQREGSNSSYSVQ